MTELGFFVRGVPRPQGSVRAIHNRVINGNETLLPPWRQAITAACCDAMTAAGLTEPLTGPLQLGVTFYLPRPVSEPKTRVTWPVRKPDLDKLLRAVGDALTDAHLWVDDAQVVGIDARKTWAQGEQFQGAHINVKTVEAGP